MGLHINYIALAIHPFLGPCYCLSLALDAHMLSHTGYGPGPRAQKGPSSRSELRALFDYSLLDSIGLDCIGLDSIGLDLGWIGLD